MLSRKSLIVLVASTLSLLALLTASRQLSWAAFQDAPYGWNREPNWHKGHHPRPPGNGPHHPHSEPPPTINATAACHGFPDTSKILLIMKTGASESFARIPTQIMTMLKCMPNDFLIFSDLEQDIGGYHIYDSLTDVLPTVKDGNSDFDLYRRQQECLIDIGSCNKLGNPGEEGWNLDKYKNIHVAERVYELRPGYEWYVFIDADTYVLMPNMAEWLGKMDPKEKRYLGSVTLINDFSFGHGGSGYVVSQAAMEDFVGKHPGVGNMYDWRAKNECCGDYVFGMAIRETSEVSVEQMWPTINGEKPSTLPFGPSHWCQPIVTMHHMSAEEIDSFWKFERSFASSEPRPLLIKDIFHHYLAPFLFDEPLRSDWDNTADDTYYLDPNSTHVWEDWRLDRVKKATWNKWEEKAHDSPEACEAACLSVKPDECFMWKWTEGCCAFGKSFRMGKPVKKERWPQDRTVSGWDVGKIEGWIHSQGDCERREVRWPGLGS